MQHMERQMVWKGFTVCIIIDLSLPILKTKKEPNKIFTIHKGKTVNQGFYTQYNYPLDMKRKTKVFSYKTQ